WSSRASVRSLPPFLFLLFRLLPTSLLFPYTTLFRSDFIAKLAQGHADDLLSTLCLARNCPLLVAPTMNVQMWTNPATQRNVAQRSEEHTSELQSPDHLVCRLLLEKKKKKNNCSTKID